jgi:hypothetical protein
MWAVAIQLSKSRYRSLSGYKEYGTYGRGYPKTVLSLITMTVIANRRQLKFDLEDGSLEHHSNAIAGPPVCQTAYLSRYWAESGA